MTNEQDKVEKRSEEEIAIEMRKILKAQYDNSPLKGIVCPDNLFKKGE